MAECCQTVGAVLCAVLLALLLWWQLGRLLRPLPPPGARVVIPARGEGDGVEHTLRAFQWLRGMGLLRCPLVILDLGLTPEGKTLCRRLSGCWPGVVFTDREGLWALF